MKILHVLTSFGPSPAARRLAEVARAERGLRHHVISLDGDLSALKTRQSQLIGEAFLAGHGRPDRLGLRGRIAESAADILCTYGLGALDAALANAAGPKLPHIHHCGEAEKIDTKGAARLRAIAASGGFVVTGAASEAERARKRWRIPKERLRLIRPGVNTREFRPFPDRAGDGEMVTAGYVGDLNDEGLAAGLVRAAANVRARSALQFAIYGEGLARPAAESLARSKGARGRIFFRGAPKSLAAVYDEFDIFVVGGERGSPDRLLEAMASGLPAIGGDAEAAATVAEENLALLTAPGDTEALTKVLGRLVNDASLRTRVGSANAAKARAEFTLTKMTAAYAALYREAAG